MLEAQHSTAQHSTAQHSTAQHLDNLSIKLTQLKLLLPEIFCEEQIDFQKFQQLFSEHITTEPERYMLNWAGKSEAYRVLQAQTRKTLTPQPAESVNFDSTENIFIEGENLDVLKVLQKSYFNSIKMIYIDPPYNTGNDFVYNDNFKQDLKAYLEQSGELDEEGKLKLAFRKNSKENGHFHSKWLNMMLPRLHLAKNLLKDDGVIFISIDDNEQAQLKLLCDEVFGEENFVDTLIVKKSSNGMGSKEGFSTNHDFLLVYKKDLVKSPFIGISVSEDYIEKFNKSDEHGRYKVDGLFRKKGRGARKEDSPGCFYPIFGDLNTGKVYLEPKEGLVEILPYLPNGRFGRWVWSKAFALPQLYRLYVSPKSTVYIKDYWSDNLTEKPRSILDDNAYLTDTATNEIIDLFGEKLFSTPKPNQLLIDLIDSCTVSQDLILDFFSGSGTTAHAVMQLNATDNGNRRFICVQLPEVTDEKSEAFKAGFKNIAEISKERIRRAGKQIAENHPDKQIDTGFKVFKLTDSHFKQWQSPSAENLAQQIELFVDSVRKEATPDAMLYEILLRLGLKLTAKVRLENQVFWVCDESGQQFALLLETLSADLLDQVISAQPKKVVTLDSLFNGDDALKKNAELQMNDAGIAFFVL